MLTRRSFLALGLSGATALALDPERLLWVPGARTFFIPDTTIVEAKTIEEALHLGFVAVFPDGARMQVQVGAGLGMTVDERFACERRAVERMGGRIVEHRQWRRHPV